MEMKLAENIRRFRKQRSLTQEQLAEVLGVTSGAVYKWEAGLSVPDLELIMEMADFFDTSVDVLLGYEMKDNRLEATVKRLQEYRREKDIKGLAEAEKAIKRYPHSFEIVKESASLYGCFGTEQGETGLFLRALELLEQSLLLLSQNRDPKTSEQTIYGQMAIAYLGMEQQNKAIELLKTHNAGGLYNSRIGHYIAQGERCEEAVPFLSEALASIVTDLIHTIIGYLNVYIKRGDHASAQAILSWGIELILGLRKDGKPNFLDKICSALLAALAWSQWTSGQEDQARITLKQAWELAAFFDAAPSYDESDIRFIDRIEGASAYDDIGSTAMEAVINTVNGWDSAGFAALWQSVREEEEKHG